MLGSILVRVWTNQESLKDLRHLKRTHRNLKYPRFPQTILNLRVSDYCWNWTKSLRSRGSVADLATTNNFQSSFYLKTFLLFKKLFFSRQQIPPKATKIPSLRIFFRFKFLSFFNFFNFKLDGFQSLWWDEFKAMTGSSQSYLSLSRWLEWPICFRRRSVNFEQNKGF